MSRIPLYQQRREVYRSGGLTKNTDRREEVYRSGGFTENRDREKEDNNGCARLLVLVGKTVRGVVLVEKMERLVIFWREPSRGKKNFPPN
jgi:hypothetical protein